MELNILPVALTLDKVIEGEALKKQFTEKEKNIEYLHQFPTNYLI
jgi:hypothetical protein